MDKVRWEAIDEDGAGAHLLKAARSTTEAVAIVKNGLTVDPDDLADRASVGDPEWNPRIEEDLVVGKLEVLGDLLLNLHQDHVGSVLGVGGGEDLGQWCQIPFEVELHIGSNVVARFLLLRGRPVLRPTREGDDGVTSAGSGSSFTHEADGIERHAFPF